MTGGIRLLYVEDNPFDADLTLRHFEREAPDLHLEAVSSGKECLEGLAKGTFDLLLLDYHLGDTDGVVVLKALRASGNAIPVVMLTGAGDDESIERALRAGADDYVVKSQRYLTSLPDRVRALIARIRDRASLPTLGTARVRRVLYVEPNPADAELTTGHLLKEAPHLRLHIVPSCLEALDLLLNSHGIDLVLTELRVPGMDALKFIHEATGRGVTIPFIVITGQGDEATAVGILRLGASDYIVKRDNYLTQLPHAIDHALQRFQLDKTTRRLRMELGALNASLEERVASRTTALMAEVAERKVAEQDARESSERYHRTLENMLEGCQIISPDSRYLFVNEAAARHGRRSKEEFIGHRMEEVYPGIEATVMFASLRRCMDERVAARFENAFAYGDGTAGWFQLSIEPVPEGVFILSIDITERKRAEQALRRSEENLAVTLQSIGDGVIATDPAGRVTLLNSAAENLTGWTASEATGRALEEVFRVVNAETRKALTNPVKKIMDHGEIVGLANHATLLSRSGAEYQIAHTAAPIRDSAGQVGGVVLIFKDVTEAYRVQKALRDRERQLTLITDALPGPVTQATRDGRYVFANAACARVTGRPLEEIIGHTRLEVLGQQVLDERQPLFERALAGERVTFEASFSSASDGIRHLLITLLPECDEKGGVSGVLSVAMDISDRKNAEERLRQSEALLRIAGRTAHLGAWAIDLVERRITLSDEVCEIYEIPLGAAPDFEASVGFMAPEWRGPLKEAIEVCRHTGTPFDLELEIITATGRRLWVRTTGEGEPNASGAVTRVHGAIQDINSQKEGEQKIRAQLNELLRWQDVMVNRETRVQELKGEVNSLLARMGLNARYLAEAGH